MFYLISEIFSIIYSHSLAAYLVESDRKVCGLASNVPLYTDFCVV